MAVRKTGKQYIKIRGANENNLKNLDVDIPRDEFVVLTGLSGSGKSSLAFDTIYAEGQRRYMESLSSYARQFLGQMEKPNVESIEGLSPAISIDQKSTNRNPRSTVGTVTEIYDYLRCARFTCRFCDGRAAALCRLITGRMVSERKGCRCSTRHGAWKSRIPLEQMSTFRCAGRSAASHISVRMQEPVLLRK